MFENVDPRTVGTDEFLTLLNKWSDHSDKSDHSINAINDLRDFIYRVVEADRVGLVQKFVELGYTHLIPFSSRCSKTGHTLLHTAVGASAYGVADYLISAGADPKQEIHSDSDSDQPLITEGYDSMVLAISSFDINMIRLLIDSGVSIDFYYIKCAINFYRYSIYEQEDVFERFCDVLDVLIGAIKWNNKEMLDKAYDDWGNPLWFLFDDLRHPDGSDVKYPMYHEIGETVSDQLYQICRTMIRAGFDVNRKVARPDDPYDIEINENFWSYPIFGGIRTGHTEIVKLFFVEGNNRPDMHMDAIDTNNYNEEEEDFPNVGLVSFAVMSSIEFSENREDVSNEMLDVLLINGAPVPPKKERLKTVPATRSLGLWIEGKHPVQIQRKEEKQRKLETFAIRVATDAFGFPLEISEMCTEFV